MTVEASNGLERAAAVPISGRAMAAVDCDWPGRARGRDPEWFDRDRTNPSGHKGSAGAACCSVGSTESMETAMRHRDHAHRLAVPDAPHNERE
jgi:hypothetical protein